MNTRNYAKMFRYTNTVRDVARQIDEAVRLTIQDGQNQLIEQEPAFTERLLTRIQDRIDGKIIRGIKWKAKTLTDRGRGSQEHRFGADFLGVLNIELPDFVVAKGFLAQAKNVNKTGPRMSLKDYDAMKDQCNKMLKVTPDSFVFLYDNTGVEIVPASSIVAATRCNPHELYSKTITGFFISYLECFIGDPRIHVPSLQQLELLQMKFEVSHVFALAASEPEKKPKNNQM